VCFGRLGSVEYADLYAPVEADPDYTSTTPNRGAADTTPTKRAALAKNFIVRVN